MSLQTSVLRRCQSAENNLVSVIRVNPLSSVARLFVCACLVAAAAYLRLCLRLVPLGCGPVFSVAPFSVSCIRSPLD
jgi:hypothetical protein